MEILFLIENVLPEILFLFLFIIIFVSLLWHTWYLRIKDFWGILTRKSRFNPVHQINNDIPKDNAENSSTSWVSQDIQQEQKKQPETPDTSHKDPIPNQETSQNSNDEIPKDATLYIEKLLTLTKSSKTLIAKWMLVEARPLIVEWLSIDKNHRDLNMLLWQVYEQEGDYEKAEYIYKDIAHIYPNDAEILEKLGNILIIEKKYIIASEIYKKILSLTSETEETLYMLTNISQTLWDPVATEKYAQRYIRQWPKNPDILLIFANAQLALWKRKQAIDTFKTIKNLTPYNAEITETLQKLLVEEELAGNFSPHS